MTQTPTPRALVEQLVALDTTSATGNRPAVDVLAGVLADAGAEVEVLPDADPRNANLVATFPATLPTPDGSPFADPADPERRGVMIAGHLDCVPVTDQTWTTDPFTPTEREGRLYGRGTADMKSYLAIAAALAPELMAAPRTVPVHLAATWDEETTCTGAAQLVDQLAERGIRPVIALVGEPTGMRAVTAHKSMNVLGAEFRGIAAHSSLLPRGLNAIRYAARFIDWYHREVVDALREQGPRDDAFTVPYSTGGVNVAEGGIALNTVPDHVRLLLEFRALPAVDIDPILARIRAEIDRLDAEMRAAVPADPADPVTAGEVGASLEIISLLYALDGAPDSPAVRAALALGAEPTAQKVSYGTEAGIYERAGMSAVVVGPGSIDQAHGADEYVELDQLARCEHLLRELIAAVGRTPGRG